MSKENQNETNDNIIKDSQKEKYKINSSLQHLNEKEKNDFRINQNLSNLQSSASKNLKNDVKSESANIYV